MRAVCVLFFSSNRDLLEKKKKVLKKYDLVFLVSSNPNLENYTLDGVQIKFIFFDSNKMIFSDETWKIVNRINTEIESISLYNSAYLYQLSSLIEGGVAQNIADFLFSIDIFQDIIRENKISKIYCDDICNYSEILALQCIAREAKIDFTLLSTVKKLSHIKYNFLSGGRNRFYVFLVCVKNIVRDTVKIASICKANSKDANVSKYDVAFIFQSNANKHINWLIDSLDAVPKDLSYCVFCYHADEARKQFHDLGINAKSVEAYWDWKVFGPNLFSYVIDTYKIRKRLRSISKFEFRELNTTREIYDIVNWFYANDVFINILYEKVVRKFVKKNKVRFITGDGDSNFITNRIFYMELKANNDLTLFFKDSSGIEIINAERQKIYEPWGDMISIRFFSPQSLYLRELKRGGWKGKVYYTDDSVYREKFKKYNEMAESTIEGVEYISILWAPSYPMKGHYTVNNFFADNECVLSNLADMNINLYVKFHPNQDIYYTERIVNKYASFTNIRFIGKEEAIETVIKKVDLVLTTPSTVMIDAALMHKMVVCIAENQGFQLIEHMSDGFWIVKRTQIDWQCLINCIKNRYSINSEYNKYTHRQYIFLKRYFSEGYTAMDAIKDMINNEHSSLK